MGDHTPGRGWGLNERTSNLSEVSANRPPIPLLDPEAVIDLDLSVVDPSPEGALERNETETGGREPSGTEKFRSLISVEF